MAMDKLDVDFVLINQITFLIWLILQTDSCD